MERVFGLDIGTTSIGFAVIDHDAERQSGRILRLGVRVFPEARDKDGTPLNQVRREKRMLRRQLRRRRARRKLLNETLTAAGLLPAFGSADWTAVMKMDAYDLRKRGLSEPLSAWEVGRSLYHLAKRRHFAGRALSETDDGETENADEKAAKSERQTTLQTLKTRGVTLGVLLSECPPHRRRRGVHADRAAVRDEFERLWAAQARRHEALRNAEPKARIEDAIFAQRPVFWRKTMLGACRFMPGAPLCPKGSWLSQQKRMLEKLNNLALAGNLRPLDEEERAAILARLQTQGSMSWAGVRSALKPLYKARGEPGGEKRLKFNLEVGGESRLPGNAVEAKLAAIFGPDWRDHPHKQAIREAVTQRMWSADYGEIGGQRVVILSAPQREARREEAAASFIRDFGITPDQADALMRLTFPTGWEPYSIQALRAFLPHLEAGARFGALLSGPQWEDWRNETFPDRDRPTGEILDRLPSPAVKEERARLARLRNPTVLRTQNELRKVVNNLIAMFGKPDRIRIEMARDVGKSKRECEEIQSAIRKQESRRKAAARDLQAKSIAEASRDDIEKWLLWKECGERCPYTGDQIGFDALFRDNAFEVEHIWPRSRSLDNSFRNKTLCRKDINIKKGNRTPFEYLGHDADRWASIQTRLHGIMETKGGMPPGKVRRFLAKTMPDDFASRQLNDTGYAARQAVALLKRLWPDPGGQAPVTVQAVSGRVTAQLRKLWTLNNILSDHGEKTRADHRHHAVDALTVACAHPGMTARLSGYWQAKDDTRAPRPHLPPPWPTIRNDAETAVADIIVSHRVRKKVSGPLHKETTYGDTRKDEKKGNITYRWFVTRKKVEELTQEMVQGIRDKRIADPHIRKIIQQWVAERGDDPKKAFPPYPRLGESGPEIRKVRLEIKQQLALMAPVTTGYADLGANHHIAIYRQPDGTAVFEVVSLFEAARRLARREPVVRRKREDDARFVMSLAPGDAIQFPSGEKRGLWIVQGAWANGQIVIAKALDAKGSTVTTSKPSVILRDGCRKVSIDPIGRIRKAGD